MFNWGVCNSCKKSKSFNSQAVGCDLTKCQYEPIPTNSVNNTTCIYSFTGATNRTQKEKNNEQRERNRRNGERITLRNE